MRKVLQTKALTIPESSDEAKTTIMSDLQESIAPQFLKAEEILKMREGDCFSPLLVCASFINFAEALDMRLSKPTLSMLGFYGIFVEGTAKLFQFFLLFLGLLCALRWMLNSARLSWLGASAFRFIHH